MGGCSKGVSRCILLSVNTLIFIIAAAGLGVSIYVFYDVAAKAMTRMSLLMAVFIVSIVLMIFSCLGCKTALNPPHKKCSKCTYLTMLLILFIAEFVAAGYIFNIGHALQVAKDHHFDVQNGVDKAAEDAIVFLHDQLEELYVSEKCTGGHPVPPSETLPFTFSKVECQNDGATQAFEIIFKDASIDDQKQYAAYQNCTTDKDYKESEKEFTQAFCGSETEVVSLANKYAHYLVWFPVCLAALTFILLVATICLIAQRKQPRREALLPEGDGRVQIARR